MPSAKHFHDEAAAYAWVEARVWSEGPVCPHCGGVERIFKMGGASTRIGAYKCYQCRMARKPKKNEKAQSERFKETARKLGVDETGKSFEEAFAKIVPAKRIKAQVDGR